MPTPTRLRIPVLVVAAIVLGLARRRRDPAGRGPRARPSRSRHRRLQASPSPTPTPAPTATDPLSTPEGAVRAFFAAFAAARRTDDPAGSRAPSSPATESSAYLIGRGVPRRPEGRRQGVGRDRSSSFDNIESRPSTATRPRSPSTTPRAATTSTSTPRRRSSRPRCCPRPRSPCTSQVGGRWLVDAYEVTPQ